MVEGPASRHAALHPEMARVAALLYGAGGALVLVTLLFPAHGGRLTWLLATVASVAVLVAAGFLWTAERVVLPFPVYVTATALGSTLITVAVVAGGRDTTSAYGVMYVLALAYAFFYYPVGIALAEVALVAIGYGIGLSWHAPPAAGAQWVMVVGASLAVGAVIGTLGGRVRRLLSAEHETVARLRELDVMKDTFITAISHEIRTPLTVIVGLTKTLRDHRRRLDEGRQDDLVVRLAVNAVRLERLIENVMDIQRLTHGVVSAHRDEIDLSQLILDVAEGVELDGPLHTNGHPVHGRVDPTLTRRIVQNLLLNAVKYTVSGTPIWVWAERAEDAVTIVVEDAGPGVPDGLKEEIFDPFTRGDPDHPSPGTGVGLALVSRFAALHDGHAWVEDRPGGGARFCVELPDGPGTPSTPSRRLGPRRATLVRPLLGPSLPTHQSPDPTTPREEATDHPGT